MSVKPITNKSIVASSGINRAKQVSTKDTSVRENLKKSYVPGANYSNNYAVTLKDIDTAIMSHLKDVIKPTVKEANENVEVSVMYGNEERWANYRKRGTIRDKNGSLILPLIMFRRTDINKNSLSGQGFKHDVKKDISVVRNSKWSKKNRYDRFSVQTGKNPVYEALVTGMPDFRDITYEFVLWTGFIEQMNPLIETIVSQGNTYWGVGEKMKFLCSIESITDASEMNQDGERFIKSTFGLVASAYLLPEYINSSVTNKVSNMKKVLSPSRVVFGYEGDATNNQVKK